ncbi:McKusick-Kaufman/Bardet-Biedl syndromes putative chaperonin [Rhinatrema bivittatum]|uniref:McKusick-Kaufman/Bardet-Biedl syndromes putative chaperonin n=1 Tax=Rhinatrema bivittatum TaxID=194408 RepID=UPI0011298ADF|nr:McKusick-Kaufman/Bardet-Biedl syndromes putative chaperonin [Rhinatrema bivittatum]XP_029449385.1 McKusick-Kaufman/Bardet-Biedl syndromes putative chaperonin [Rhinatrema bivittatum]XP_029449386.1 McKusick-Kaufman/Bardet-Biedl syndromes putative chaperonin [Rhinatrema bivittatum]XP_029449387.1 McKusick-Kaufman/Bardet-Biedl syndromes putative chaperonin [Rhinatrema bivittatum]XP_029449389.1 McKusick-Kaufman/Bardet-Biedl syndromes putative chaperonin [Rhinatrema bivittatum]XP_029449390.1 McKus
MAMSRVEPKKASLCTSGPLNQEIISKSLSTLSEIVKSCYGPSGRLKQLHNGMGGKVCTTSQSSALLDGFSVSHPVLKILVASVRTHVSRFSDCGLFSAILCCNLIEKFQRTALESSTVIKISRHILSLCSSYLKSEECNCRVAVDFDSCKALLSLVRTILTSKPACMLTVKEADYVSMLLLKTFLLTVPNETGKNVILGQSVIVPIEGQKVTDSTVFPGLLIEIPEFQLRRIFPVTRLSPSTIQMALFSISLSGELSDTGQGMVIIQSGVSPEQAVLEQLILLGEQMVKDQVGIVVCQKVIHPSLKHYLKEHHVMVVDRVGAPAMEPLRKMTGAEPIASLHPVSSACYGDLKDVLGVNYASKQFLHLVPNNTAVCSLVLCNRNETTLDELKRACHTAEHVLQMTLKQPLALLGGGCTETHLALYIRYQAGGIGSSILEDLNCTRTEYQIVANSFCQSLESVARCLEHDDGEILTDTHKGHFWSVPSGAASGSSLSDCVLQCGCGMYTKQQHLTWCILGSQSEPFAPQACSGINSRNSSDPLVLDCFAAKCNSLQVAVETSHLILDLSYIIEDQN